MLGSHARAPARPRCRGSDDRHAPVARKGEPADRGADARGTPPRQIAIGMLNDVQCGDRVKLVFWDGTGVVLVAKRLENGKFSWPAIDNGVMRLSAAQLQALLEGLDWRRVHEARRTTVPTAAS